MNALFIYAKLQSFVQKGNKKNKTTSFIHFVLFARRDMSP